MNANQILGSSQLFQRVMESILNGIPGVVVYIDDILVTGATEEEHLAHQLEEAGLRLKSVYGTFCCIPGTCD